MKILKMKLFQEVACYRKPFSTKTTETYPLPPYSTIIGMLHKILEAKNGEVYRFSISVQGNSEKFIDIVFDIDLTEEEKINKINEIF